MQRTDFSDMVCSIARTVAVAGEPWTPLIVRDVWVGINRFDAIQADLGISSKVLTDRLKTLVAHGVLERRPYSERPPRHEYALTTKGEELCSVLMAMTAWGDKHADDGNGPPVLLRHRDCGHVMTPTVCCSACGEPIDGSSVSVQARSL